MITSVTNFLALATASELSWQLHMPESTIGASQQTPQTPPAQSAAVLEAQWRSEVLSKLLAKNLVGAQQSLNAAPTQNLPVALLTSRAAWLLGLGLVPWAETTLEEALRHSNQLDSTQQKALQNLKASFYSAYATEQSQTAILRDLSAVLPTLLAKNPNSKAYQQWQILEGPERLSLVVQLQRQELALLGASLEESSPSSVAVPEEPVFPAALKPSLVETIKTLKASQRVLNNAAGVVDIGLHQRRLTPTEYNQQCADLIDFLTQQQQRVSQYKSRLEQRVASVPANTAQHRQWKNALNESVALVTLHQAALAALRESIEAPFASQLSPLPSSSSASIAKELPLLEALVMQRLQGALNGWDSVSVAQAMLEVGLPLSFPLSLHKALTLDTSRAVRMLTTPLPAPLSTKAKDKAKTNKKADKKANEKDDAPSSDASKAVKK